MALEQDMALLARVPVFSQLNNDGLRLLAFSAESRMLDAGDILFRAGEPSDGGYVVSKGGIALMGSDGKPIGGLVLPDHLIGEMALITETFRPVTALAQVPSVVLKVSRASFRRTLEEYPVIAQTLMRAMKERITVLSQELARVKDSFQKPE